MTVFKPELRLLDSHITPKGLDPYGRIKCGHLLLSTEICRIPATRLRHESVFLGIAVPYKLIIVGRRNMSGTLTTRLAARFR